MFLCVTGAEALYADMGHFGARPIRVAWSALVFPSLVLNYAGQAALVLEGTPTSDNIFYRLCPAALLVPMVLLATVATIIASQSIITGAFSMTRQAIQLGWLPRLQITQTSAEGYGQIYVGPVNWLLMIVTVGLAIGFRKSDNLAAAYGIAVSATMLMTAALLFIAMREIWQWSLPAAASVAGVFLVVDAALCRGQHAEGAGGRLCASGAGCARLWDHAGLASGQCGRQRPAAGSGHADRCVRKRDHRGENRARARNRGVPDAHSARRATRYGLVREACSCAARAAIRAHRHNRIHALGARGAAAALRTDRP